ncbi:alkaline phosphatase family protein [Phenylobacterium sp.]|uniref:alkaline phosphatase family protein n=1 Tax=Phenylobacterium sp. TaxID=1871053 RepID=UPI0011F8D8D3|nr:alkaline phosphatase family protein [Phenylobacterium sp.]THD60312.1 MAG: alkaline phosphatase family protein [Phenylobacterium sp.]
MQQFRFAAAGVLAAALLVSTPAQAAPRNVIIFVADGLRSHSVTPESAPALAAVRSEGVDFANSHSLFPTVTTANGSAIATGHLLGDTGDFANTIYAGVGVASDGSPLTDFENDEMLGLMNQRFAGNYLGEVSLLQAARARGYATAALGKEGPAGVQDATARDGTGTVVLDSAYPKNGIRLAPEIAQAIQAAGLASSPPQRGKDFSGGDFKTPGTLKTNAEQQDWFVGVATKVLIPRFKAEGKPFVMVFWSLDPDGTQHGNGDSLNSLTPGINGPTSRAAIRNASNDLQALRDALQAQGLADNTDIVITADHGFSTKSLESPGSAAASFRYPDVKPGFLPRGFLAIDLSKALNLPLFSVRGAPVDPAKGEYPKGGALLGADPAKPEVVIAPNGGAMLLYLPGANAKAMARKVVAALTRQDYVAAIFVNDALGEVPGALPMSKVNLIGAARTPQPSIVLSFRSFSTGCADPEMCGVEIADSGQQQGQGIHGTLGRQDTHNFMAAVGPDFKRRFVDPAPVSNADWANTLAYILGIELPRRGHLVGRVMNEALLAGGPAPPVKPITVRSKLAANGFVTVLNAQVTPGETYLDAAGMPGRTLGLKP